MEKKNCWKLNRPFLFLKKPSNKTGSAFLQTMKSLNSFSISFFSCIFSTLFKWFNPRYHYKTSTNLIMQQNCISIVFNMTFLVFLFSFCASADSELCMEQRRENILWSISSSFSLRLYVLIMHLFGISAQLSAV